ncbi:MAG: class I SAM-dependent methyltransferase [Verrucomicrobiaceae bacterium]
MNREHPILKRPTKTKESPYSKDEWKLLECEETGLVYLDNPVEYEELEDDYAWEKLYKAEKEDRKRREPIFSKLSAATKKIRKAIRKVPKIHSLPIELAKSRFGDRKEITLLDIGCGYGNYPRFIAEKITEETGIKVIPFGIEISTALAEAAQATLGELGGGCVQSSAVDGIRQIDDASQDMIILHSFLEHETNPRDLLEGCRQKISKDGLLIIKVPNYACLNRKVRQGKWCGFRYPDHVNYFSPNNLTQILELSGFKIHRMNIFDRFPTSDNMWVIAEGA